MSILTTGPIEPISSGEFDIPVTDPERRADVEQKHSIVSEFLRTHRYDAMLLQRPHNIAWFTAGADVSRGGSSQPTAALFITPEARVVVTSDTDSAEIFDRHLSGLGFQLKERPWREPRYGLAEDLCRGRAVAGDTGFGPTQDISAHLGRMRIPYTSLECERSRRIGRCVAHAVEATARQCLPGQTEAEIAGEVAHRMIKQQITPERIQVWADGQSEQYPHWSYGNDRVERYVVIAVVGRRWGQCVAASRTVCFGDAPEELLMGYQRAALVQTTGMFFSQPNWELFETWKRVRRIYEKYGCPDEWRRAEQAEIIGYDVCEVPVVPDSEFRIESRMAVHWHPFVGPALLSDTILVADNGFDILTPPEDWPRLQIDVKGITVIRPAILRREK